MKPVRPSVLLFNVLVCACAAAVGGVAAGCQTSKGFGQDVEKLGEKIQEKSK